MIEVNDEAVNKKITILDIVAVMTIPLISTIGYLNISTQNRLIDGQNEMRMELGNTNTFLSTHELRITRSEKDIDEVRIISSSNSDRLYILEGEHNAKPPM